MYKNSSAYYYYLSFNEPLKWSRSKIIHLIFFHQKCDKSKATGKKINHSALTFLSSCLPYRLKTSSFLRLLARPCEEECMRCSRGLSFFTRNTRNVQAGPLFYYWCAIVATRGWNARLLGLDRDLLAVSSWISPHGFL